MLALDPLRPVGIHVSVNWAINGSDNGLSPVQHLDIILTKAGLLSVKPLGTSFSEILPKI